MARRTALGFDNSDKYRDLGYAIAYYRKQHGLTQEMLAEKIGISRQHMGAIEAPHMNRALSLEVIYNIASVLDVDVYKFFKFAPEK